MVGVILHERRAALEAARHDLHRADERTRLPVAFAAETKASGHHALRADARQLREAVQIFKGVGVALEAAGSEKLMDAQFDARRFADGFVTLAALLQIAGHLV